jgi:hypothetical protein
MPNPGGPEDAGMSTRAVLAFARTHPRRCTDSVTRSALGLSATAYYQRLLALLDRVEAAVVEPALIDRLRTERNIWQQARGST